MKLVQFKLDDQEHYELVKQVKRKSDELKVKLTIQDYLRLLVLENIKENGSNHTI